MGKAAGYQKGTMDAFNPYAKTSSGSLDGVYVDGISITTSSPRKHVWTYAARVSDEERYRQLLLYLLAVTTIVSLVLLEHYYGME